MSKIICNSIDFVFASEIAMLFFDQVTLKQGASWRNLPVNERPVYSSEIRQEDAGPTREETVSAKTRYDAHAILKAYSNYPIVLRMKTDSSTFYVGSQQYPVVSEITDDKVYDSYSFKAKSIP